jgi:anaerobic ribonucleoside-triphosphate reductase activating protein
MKINELVSLIDSNTPLRRITISGGEPLLQMDGLMELVRQLRASNYDIAVYTGNSLEDVPRELLSMINYIKVGDYRKEYHTTVKPYVGSMNQEFIKLR